LNKNKSYDFSLCSEVSSLRSCGNWEVKDDTLILNQLYKYKGCTGKEKTEAKLILQKFIKENRSYGVFLVPKPASIIKGTGDFQLKKEK